MKVTKYPQSCLLIEKDGKRLLIDPGSFVSASMKPEDLLPLDVILITHEHSDHVDPGLLKNLTLAGNIPVIANRSTKNLLGEVVTNIMVDQEELVVAGFRITARELAHCLMLDGSPGPDNTGYVIDGVFFHPGDGKEIDNLTVETAAIPIFGPDISLKDAYDFSKSLACKKVIPIHNDVVNMNPEAYAKFAAMMGLSLPFEIITLQNGGSAEV